MLAAPAKIISVLLVDDHNVVRSGIRLLIERRKEFAVVGDTGTCAEALQLAAREQPDVILLDLNLGCASGLDILPGLFKAAPGARVIILTGDCDQELHQRAIQAGATGLFMKGESPELLFKAIEKVHGGEIWLDRGMIAWFFSGRPLAKEKVNPEHARIASLTEREREVVTLITQGLKNKQLAERLFISEGTVRHHLTSAFDKLGVKDRLELSVYAFRHGLAVPPR